jgi:hypothetical protein
MNETTALILQEVKAWAEGLSQLHARFEMEQK